MIRTQLSLTAEQKARLDERARRTGVSLSHLVREAVDAVYPAERDLGADLHAISQAAGSWADRDLDGRVYVESVRSGRRLPRA